MFYYNLLCAREMIWIYKLFSEHVILIENDIVQSLIDLLALKNSAMNSDHSFSPGRILSKIRFVIKSLDSNSFGITGATFLHTFFPHNNRFVVTEKLILKD